MTAEDRLTCGTPARALIEHVADDAPVDEPHVAGCAHCQDLLARLRQLWSLTGQLAAREVTAPAGIDAAVMRRIHRERFVTESLELLGGILPRLGWAVLTYTGIARAPRR